MHGERDMIRQADLGTTYTVVPAVISKLLPLTINLTYVTSREMCLESELGLTVCHAVVTLQEPFPLFNMTTRPGPGHRGHEGLITPNEEMDLVKIRVE